MQLAHFLLPYGIPFVGLDFFLGALPEGWNEQNFGISGMTSRGLYDHLLNCLRANGDKAPFPENYKIARNVAFHIGGNDFIGYTPLIAYMPWKFNDVKNLVLYNYEKIISMFIRRKRNVLLIGHYPTVSYSFRWGAKNEYFYTFQVVSSELLGKINFNFHLYEKIKNRVANLNQDPFFKPNEDIILKDAVNELLNHLRKYFIIHYFNQYSLQIFPFLKFLGFENEFFNKLLKLLANDRRGTCDAKQVGFKFWFYCIAADFSTISSLGMMAVDSELPEIAERRNLDAINYGVKIHYLKLWHFFTVHDNGMFLYEPWVVNPSLMADPWHPNIFGMNIWGYHVGNKIMELGWHLDKFDVRLQTVKNESSLLSQDELNQINDRNKLPNEHYTTPPNPEPNLWDLLILCWLLGGCRK
jgi:lysophospholipase L1-like esterase